MDRETYKLVMAIGVLVNSALYLGGCFVAGLVLARPLAWQLALAALGVTYLSYLAHISWAAPGDRMHTLAIWLAYLSIALGAAAGLLLLVG